MESTAKVPTGLFYDTCMVAMEKAKRGELTKMDWRFHFLPWWKHPQYVFEDDRIVIPS
jgi:hypothetical protein